jgi:glycosyltransferase involved in cell wall biosynthesis
MRRVIYAWNYTEWGGAQIHFLALMKEARKKHDVVVVLPLGTAPQFLGFLEAESVQYEEFDGGVDQRDAVGLTAKIRRHWKRIRSEYRMLRKVEAVGLDESIVHTDILPTSSLLSLVWLCLRTNVFITSHNALPPVPKWRWWLWKVKFGLISMFDSFHVFCTNRHAAEYFRKLYTRRVGDEIRITYDSINPAEIDKVRATPIDRDAIVSRLGIPTGTFVVLAVGQFVDRKGRWVFLEAAANVRQQIEDVVFIWVTPQLPTDADRKRIEDFRLGGSFRLVSSENVGRDRWDILLFFRTADVFALPSYVEGLPIALLEAMALGIPSISTNVYGIPEAVIDERTGLLIEPGDAEALAKAILRLKRDDELRRQLSKDGRRHVIESFDERVAARTAVAEYESAFESEK